MYNKKTPLIEIKNLVKKFDEDNIVINNISIEIYAKEFFALLGSSGSGKSTLLRIIAGFEKPNQGKIIIDGIEMNNIPPYKRPVNMMFQSYALFPHMTIEKNIMFGLKQDKLSKREILNRTISTLKIIKMLHLAKRKPYQLSGGQKQRVALARCLAKRPKLILLDEPLSALDKNLREQMQFELVDIQEQTGSTFIMVTHDQEEAMIMATRIGIMSEGVLEQVSTPQQIYEFPTNKFVAKFIGKNNIFESKIESITHEYSIIKSVNISCIFKINKKIQGKCGQKIWIGIRSEKFKISKIPPKDYNEKYPINTIHGIIQDIAYIGAVSTYHIKINFNKIIKATAFNILKNTENITWYDKVFLSWHQNSIMVLYA